MSAPAPVLPLSPFTVHDGLIFTSGQIHLSNGELVKGSTEDKTHQVMKNLQKVLESAGSSLSKVLKTTIYVTDMAIYADVNKVYATYFDSNFPAREVIGVRALPLGAEIEISMIASK